MIGKLTILHEYGAPRHFLALYYLQRQGFIKEIQAMEFNIPIQIAKAALHQREGSLSRCFYNVKTLTKLLFVENEIIVIGAAPYDLIIPYLAYLKNHNNVIYHTSWTDWTKPVKKACFPGQIGMWQRFLFKTKTVTPTEAAMKEVQRYGAIAHYIPHSVDTEIFRPRETHQGKQNVRVLYVGTMVRQKGILALIEAAKVLASEHIEFWFVGRGPLQGDIKRQEGKLPVRYFGYVDDNKRLAEIYSQANILALPSIRQELFGIALIEGMASGLPVISTELPGPAEIIKDGENGFIIPRGDDKQLFNRLRVLIHDKDLREEMGKRAREMAVEKYDVKVTSKMWWGILNG